MHSQTLFSEAVALNFEAGPVPEWINVIPKGPGVRGIDGRTWTMGDANAVIETFRARGNKLPVDVEHATQIKGARGEAAPAVGFITDLENRDNGLWACVEWNQAGEDLLKSRSYAHVSPVFSFDQNRTIRRLVSVALTNNPNLDLVAMNRAGQSKEYQQMDKAVLEALGLNADATAADAVVAITKLKEERGQALNSAQHPDPEKFVPRADHELALNKVADFERAEGERARTAIEAAVDAAVAAGKIAPVSRDFHIAACKANGVEKFNAMIDGMPEIAGAARPQAAAAALPGQLDETELAMCRATGMSREDFLAAKKEQEA